MNGESSFLLPGSFLTFCPSCGHSMVAGFIDHGLRVLGYSPEQVVMVTDIGCIGMIDKCFRTNAFHGLHGRSITYGSGIKLANPALKVVVVMGDGGMGIGGGHLLAAARRNVGMTVIVANNFNYGMTGGQQSVTTPPGVVTSTTPRGSIERPLDIVETLRSARPSFLARTSVAFDDAADVVAEAVATEGFALVDIWDICVSYYGRRHLLDRETMTRMMAELEMPPVVLRRPDQPEFARTYRGVYHRGGELADRPAPRLGVDLTSAWTSDLGQRTGILIAGAAGQRVRSAAAALGAGAVMSGLHATQRDDYPITVRTGHSIAELVLSPGSVGHTGVLMPDVTLILSREGLAYMKPRLRSLLGSSRVYADIALLPIESPAQVIGLRLPQEPGPMGEQPMAFTAVRAMLEAERFYPAEALDDALRRLGAERGPEPPACR